MSEQRQGSVVEAVTLDAEARLSPTCGAIAASWRSPRSRARIYRRRALSAQHLPLAQYQRYLTKKSVNISLPLSAGFRSYLDSILGAPGATRALRRV